LSRIFISAALLLFAASAQATTSTDEAAVRFENGVRSFQHQDYSRALVEFEAAYQLVPRPAVLYNIALTERRLLHYGEAVRAFRRYLADGGGAIPPERRASVERELADIEALVTRVLVRVDGAPAEIFVDRAPVGRTPLAGPILVVPGMHVVRAARPGELPDEQTVAALAGSALEVELHPRAAPVAVAPSRPPSDARPPALDAPRPQRLRSWYRSPTTLALITSGALALGAGVGVAVDASSADRSAYASPDLATGGHLHSRANTEYAVSITLFGVGAALEIAALVQRAVVHRRERR
jgi:hypothetical protein